MTVHDILDKCVVGTTITILRYSEYQDVGIIECSDTTNSSEIRSYGEYGVDFIYPVGMNHLEIYILG